MWELVSIDLARDRGHAMLMLVRGLVGLSGLALLTARALGGRFSWTLPVAFIALIPLLGNGSGDRRWAW